VRGDATRLYRLEILFMPTTCRTTLQRFLLESAPELPDSCADCNALILDVAHACKTIARTISLGALGTATEIFAAQYVGAINVQGEVQKHLDVLSNQLFIRSTESTGNLAGMASEEMDLPHQIPAAYPRGEYLLVFDPLDGSSNIDVNVSVGSIFSILRAPQDAIDTGRDVMEVDFLQPGREQIAAGYALYGPVTMLVLSVGDGVHGFTLDPGLGEFVLTHPLLQVPHDTQEFAINSANSRFWEDPVKRYVNECLAGTSGPREKDFNMRWVASMVAEAHRILMRGGVFLYPRDTKDPCKAGRLRLLYEANPIGFIMEQAGGRASMGDFPTLDVQPTSLHQRIGLMFGSRAEVDRIDRYYAEWPNQNLGSA